MAKKSSHEEPANGAPCPNCARLRSGIRELRKRLNRLVAENRTLKEELFSAGEMIEDLAQEVEKPLGSG
ncbi:hypothetical protein HY251_13075 [bacterium]|nr:hypothetical protein [bacterium]